MKTNYKIGIVGLGSIGKRHFENIIRVLDERGNSYKIDLIRSGKNKELEEDIARNVNQVFYYDESIPSDYDVIFIANPTNLHFETIQKFVKKTRHMFIEKPIFDNSNESIEGLGLNEDNTYYVACPLRYTNVIQYFKNKVDLTKVYSARVICSSYLPEWRKNQDYTKSYSAKKAMGGGVSLDLIHEWDYLHYLFGIPEKILSLKGNVSNLKIDSDDLAIYIGKYANMMAEIHLDYFGRETIRELQMFTMGDTIVGDLVNNEVRYLRSGEVVSFRETRNDFQVKEIMHFFDIIEGKSANDNDIEKALKTLEFAQNGE